MDRTTSRVSETTDELLRDRERPLLEPLQRRLREPLPDQLPAHLNLPEQQLSDLPDQLPIRTASGEVAFVEVQLEDGSRAVRQQWLGMLAPEELTPLKQVGAEILERDDFPELGLAMVRFRVPAALDSRAALARALPADLMARLDRNHIYSSQQKTSEPAAPAAPAASSLCPAPVSVGMVDTAIATEHPGLARADIVQRDFLTGSSASQAGALSGDGQYHKPRAHGTAVAGLLVASTEARPARLPGARVYNASVFYRRNQYAQGATVMHLIKGLNWLLAQNVGVVNMSLAGPDNKVLGAAMDRVASAGVVVIAAAGNEGPAAPALYPAAYPSVIAVTAVDREGKVYRWANRGDHLDFAAPGVSVLTARSGGGFGRESGTSMAAPVISAHFACALSRNPSSQKTLRRQLAEAAEDLGEPGRDPVFGYGLLR